MHVGSPDESSNDHRYGGTGHHGSATAGSAKAANGLSSAKAAPGALRAGGDHHPDPPLSGTRATRTAPRLELSLTQILGSTAAAVTAAFLGSRLGVAGTLIGAALASVISVVGGALYTTSLKATRQRMTMLVGRSDPEGNDSPGTRSGPPLLPVAPPAAGLPVRPAPVPPARRNRPAVRGAIAGVLLSAAVFSGALLVVTGVESVTGSALSGGSEGGLTILGGNDAGRHDTSPSTPTAVTTKASPTTSSPTASTSASVTGPATAPGAGAASSSAAATASDIGVTTSPSTGTSTTAVSSTTGTPTPTPTPTATATGEPTDTAPVGGPGESAPATTRATSAPASGTTTAEKTSGSTPSPAASTSVDAEPAP
jgi:hypothetical protein